MKYNFLYIILLFLFVQGTSAQDSRLAQQFFSQGDFDKAAVEYQLLYKKFPFNKSYFYKLVHSYQKLGQYKKADSLLRMKKELKNPTSMVWLGYNFLLQKDSIKASKLFDKAVKNALRSTMSVFQTGKAFQEIYQLDEALALYSAALKKYPESSFVLDMARIYAEQNKPEEMMQAYMNYLEKYPKNLSRVRYLITPYISSINGNLINKDIKKAVIKRIKKQPLPPFYRLLEWIYIQEKDYRKAFFQLRSLYLKKQADIEEIYYLGSKALNNKKTETARMILSYVIEHADKNNLREKAQLALLKTDLQEKISSEEQLENLFIQYFQENWEKNNKIRLHILHADFLAFFKNQPQKAKEELEKLLQQNLPRNLEAEIKLKQADIAVRQGYFNQALILYTQVQLDFPNHSLGHLATYKIAQVSFFKGDIEWAHNQLKVIKSVHSDWISNDAIDLDMLIINNKEENDSLQTGLKKLAEVKYLLFKNDKENALKKLDSLRNNFKGQNIYDEILWMQAEIWEQKGNFEEAVKNYQLITKLPDEIIYKDEAVYRMARIYEQQLDQPETAKKLYKEIIIHYPSSFWFPEAQHAFRRLRGDEL